jgi:RNA polymerase sigma-70 factor (ECF subfamily)
MLDDRFLFEMIRGGDLEMFRVFFERHADRVYLYALGFMKRREDAEDVVQEVFAALWTKREGLGVVETPVAYLSRAVRNACLDRRQHARVERRYREEMAALACRETPAGVEGTGGEDPEALFHRLQDALEALPPRCREVFTLGCVEGMDYRGIAEVTGTSVNSVKTQMKIAYRKLRERMGAGRVSWMAAGARGWRVRWC